MPLCFIYAPPIWTAYGLSAQVVFSFGRLGFADCDAVWLVVAQVACCTRLGANTALQIA
jgi:hypothetical protein